MPRTADSECVVCPYCGYEHGDAWEWAAPETEGDHMKCHDCEKVFVFWAEHDVTYLAASIQQKEPEA